MSTTVDVYVAFGYDLGGDDAGWRLEGLDRWGDFDDLELPWCPPNTAHRMLDDVIESELHNGKPETYASPLRVVRYQHADISQFALVITASLITYHHGAPARVLDLSAMMMRTTRIKEWELDLRGALDRLGLKPTQRHGQWLLMSYWP